MKINKEVIVYVLLLFLLIVLCPHDQFVDDARAWSAWSGYMLHHGYALVYDCDTNTVNYNPLYLIVLRLYAGLMGSDDAITGGIYILKYFTLLIEWVGVIYLTYTLSDRANRLTNFLFCFVNIGFLYNTLLWGQIDGMLSAFIVCSIVLLYRKHLILSVLVLVLALNTKLVAVFYLPLWGLLLLQQIRTISIKSLLVALVGGVTLQVLIIFPFIRSGTLHQAIDVNFHAVGYYKYISLAAYNFWHMVFGGRLDKASDTGVWVALSYRQWGFVLFFVSAFFTLLPMLRDTLRSLRDKTWPTPIGNIMLCGGLLCLSFFTSARRCMSGTRMCVYGSLRLMRL